MLWWLTIIWCHVNCLTFVFTYQLCNEQVLIPLVKIIKYCTDSILLKIFLSIDIGFSKWKFLWRGDLKKLVGF